MKTDEILDYARNLFDVAGVTKNYLILGLVSTRNRDLDTFSWDEKKGKWRFPGFYHYFGPKVNLVIQRLRERRVHAEQRRYGELNIKELAVRAGLGKWGKNSLIIHPRFGPWLRFVAVEVEIIVYPSGIPAETEPKNLHIPYPGCKDCDRCLEACPVSGLLRPFKLSQKEKCLAYLQLEVPPISPTVAPIRRCDKCLTACMPQPEK